MAQGSLASARLLLGQGEARSSASRAYYAAYQAVTAILLYLGQTPPAGREGWGHDITPDLLQRMPGVFWKQDKKNETSARLADLYKVRIVADYQFEATLTVLDLSTALKSANYMVRTVAGVLKSKKPL